MYRQDYVSVIPNDIRLLCFSVKKQFHILFIERRSFLRESGALDMYEVEEY